MRLHLFAVPLLACATPAEKLSSSEVVRITQQMATRTMRVMRRDGNRPDRCEPIKRVDGVMWSEEEAVGGMLATRLVKQTAGGLSSSPELVAWVQRVGLHVARYSARPTIQWTFAVLEDPKPALHSVPGGWVFITTGLLAQLGNEAQLAAVLAHEIAHASRRDVVLRWLETYHALCRVALADPVLELDEEPQPDESEETQMHRTLDGTWGPEAFRYYDAKVPTKYLVWITAKLADAQREWTAEEEQQADRLAATLTGAAGYDLASFNAAIRLLSPERGAAVAKAVRANDPWFNGGKAVPFPKGIELPRR